MSQQQHSSAPPKPGEKKVNLSSKQFHVSDGNQDFSSYNPNPNPDQARMLQSELSSLWKDPLPNETRRNLPSTGPFASNLSSVGPFSGNLPSTKPFYATGNEFDFFPAAANDLGSSAWKTGQNQPAVSSFSNWVPNWAEISRQEENEKQLSLQQNKHVRVNTSPDYFGNQPTSTQRLRTLSGPAGDGNSYTPSTALRSKNSFDSNVYPNDDHQYVTRPALYESQPRPSYGTVAARSKDDSRFSSANQPPLFGSAMESAKWPSFQQQQGHHTQQFTSSPASRSITSSPASRSVTSATPPTSSAQISHQQQQQKPLWERSAATKNQGQRRYSLSSVDTASSSSQRETQPSSSSYWSRPLRISKKAQPAASFDSASEISSSQSKQQQNRPSLPSHPSRFVSRQLKQGSRFSADEGSAPAVKGGGSNRPPPLSSSTPIGIFIWGFPDAVRVKDVVGSFMNFGDIINVGIDTKNGIKYAYIDFESVHTVQEAFNRIPHERFLGMSTALSVQLRYDKNSKSISFDELKMTPSQKLSPSGVPLLVDRKTVHLSNLPHNINKPEIESVLIRLAPIFRIKIFQRAAEKKSSVFVTFKTADHAHLAAEYMRKHSMAFHDMEEPCHVEYPTQDISRHPPIFVKDPNALPTLSKKARKQLAATNTLAYARSPDPIDPIQLQKSLSVHGPCTVYLIKTGTPSTAFVQFQTHAACVLALEAKTCGVTLPRHKRVDIPLLLSDEQCLRDYFAGVADIKMITIGDQVTTIEFLTAIGAATAIVRFESVPFLGSICHADYSPSLKPEGEEENPVGDDCEDVIVTDTVCHVATPSEDGEAVSSCLLLEQPLALISLSTQQVGNDGQTMAHNDNATTEA